MPVSSLKARPLGAGMYEYTGAFAHTAGTAEETLALNAVRVESVEIGGDSSSEVYDLHPHWSQSLSGKTRTLTIHALATIAAGRIRIVASAGL